MENKLTNTVVTILDHTALGTPKLECLENNEEIPLGFMTFGSLMFFTVIAFFANYFWYAATGGIFSIVGIGITYFIALVAFMIAHDLVPTGMDAGLISTEWLNKKPVNWLMLIITVMMVFSVVNWRAQVKPLNDDKIQEALAAQSGQSSQQAVSNEPH
jgi:hypothetical protein